MCPGPPVVPPDDPRSHAINLLNQHGRAHTAVESKPVFEKRKQGPCPGPADRDDVFCDPITTVATTECVREL